LPLCARRPNAPPDLAGERPNALGEKVRDERPRYGLRAVKPLNELGSDALKVFVSFGLCDTR
jgi:hypothetical protein